MLQSVLINFDDGHISALAVFLQVESKDVEAGSEELYNLRCMQSYSFFFLLFKIDLSMIFFTSLSKSLS